MSQQFRTFSFYSKPELTDWLLSLPKGDKSRIINEALLAFKNKEREDADSIKSQIQGLKNRLEVLERIAYTFNPNVKTVAVNHPNVVAENVRIVDINDA